MYYEIIKKKIGKNNSQLEIARIIYIELGKMLSYNTDFANNPIMCDVFNKIDVNKYNQNQIVCRIWAQIYCGLLKQFGISAKVCAYGHAVVEFYINGEAWVADATYGEYTDLARIKHGDYTTQFGKAVYGISKNFPLVDEVLTNPILEKIDNNIGYNKDKIYKLKSDLETIKNSDNLIYKMDYLFARLGNMCNGYCESKQFVKEMEKIILTESELKKIMGRDLIRINKKHTDVIQCICVEDKSVYVYYLLNPNYPVKKVSIEDIIKLAILGYGIGDKSIPGIDFPNKFYESEESKKGSIFRRIKLFKECPYLKIYNESQHFTYK